MAEKVSVNFNLTPSQESHQATQQHMVVASKPEAAQATITDEEKARQLGQRTEKKAELSELREQKDRMLEDLNMLVKQNIEFKGLIQALEDEISYLKLREKKIMYLVHLLQGKGYPVTKVFENQVKSINTLRFDEFLQEEQRKAQKEAELEKQALNEFSFATDASYDLLVDGPAMKRQRPENVPALSLNELPGYVTSSEDEGEGEGDNNEEQEKNSQEQQQQQDPDNHFDQSMKYIDDYYKKQ